MTVNKSQREHLTELLSNVVTRNGGMDSLRAYYQDQNLSEDKLYEDLYRQIPPLDRQAFAETFTLDAVNTEQILPTVKQIFEQF